MSDDYGTLNPAAEMDERDFTEGIEPGLIEAIISIARVLRARGIEAYPATLAALKDLYHDEDVDWLMKQAEQAHNQKLFG